MSCRLGGRPVLPRSGRPEPAAAAARLPGRRLPPHRSRRCLPPCRSRRRLPRHKAPGRNAEARAKVKAQCCTNIITQVVRQAVEEWAARASSQGQSRQPAIIIAGDLNTPRDAFLEAMGVLQLDEDVEINAPYTGNLYVITDREVQHCEGGSLS